MKFKTLKELDRFIGEKLLKHYETELTEPLTLDEIEILRKGPPEHITWGKVNEIRSKSEERITSVLQLLYEIENYYFSGWDYGSDESERSELKFYSENRFYVYLYSTSDLIMSEVFEDNEIPVGYLFLDKEQVIKSFLSDIRTHYSNLIQEREKQSKKRTEAKVKKTEMLKSIRSKVNVDEFKFIVRNCNLTKKEVKELLG